MTPLFRSSGSSCDWLRGLRFAALIKWKALPPKASVGRGGINDKGVTWTNSQRHLITETLWECPSVSITSPRKSCLRHGAW